MTARFTRYIGIDYSGAQTPTASLKDLRVYLAESNSPPVEVLPPGQPTHILDPQGCCSLAGRTSFRGCADTGRH